MVRLWFVNLIVFFILAGVPMLSIWVVHEQDIVEQANIALLKWIESDMEALNLDYMFLSDDYSQIESKSSKYKMICILNAKGNVLRCMGKTINIYFKPNIKTTTITYRDKTSFHVQIPEKKSEFSVNNSDKFYLYIVAATDFVNKFIWRIRTSTTIRFIEIFVIIFPFFIFLSYIYAKKLKTIGSYMERTRKRIEQKDCLNKDSDLISITSRIYETNSIINNYNKLLKDLIRSQRLNQQLLDGYKLQATYNMEERKRMAAVIAHEMKVPVALIRGITKELIAEVKEVDNFFPLADDFERRLKWILAKTDILTGHVQNMTNLCRDGQIDINPEWVNLGQWTETFQDAASEIVKKSNNKLYLTCNCKIEQFYTDVNKLNQALLALLDNAVKFSSNGMIYITIVGLKERIMIEVADTGKGIEKRILARIFDPFLTIRGNGTESGLGIGLYVAKCNIEALGGTISVKSEQGVGSKFSIVLPVQYSVCDSMLYGSVS